MPSDSAKKKSQKNKDILNNRIVQTEKGQAVKTPDENALLGERSQMVDIQTVSKNQVTVSEKLKKTQSLNKKEYKQTKNINQKLNPIALNKLGIPIFSQNQPPSKEQSNALTPEQLAVVPQRAQDYVKGFKESEKTALNTKEYVFFSYFQRIRQRLDLAWDRSLREQIGKIYRQGRQIASDMEHMTRLIVTLNAIGEITRIQIIEASGTEDLDEAAVKAFNQAGPFPNPPKGIVDVQGKIQISWDFILKS